MFSIFQHAGVLQGETHTQILSSTHNKKSNRDKKKVLYRIHAFICKSVLLWTHCKRLVTFSIVPKEVHRIPTASPMSLDLFLDAWLGFQLWSTDSSESTRAAWACQSQVQARAMTDVGMAESKAVTSVFTGQTTSSYAAKVKA